MQVSGLRDIAQARRASRAAEISSTRRKRRLQAVESDEALGIEALGFRRFGDGAAGRDGQCDGGDRDDSSASQERHGVFLRHSGSKQRFIQ